MREAHEESEDGDGCLHTVTASCAWEVNGKKRTRIAVAVLGGLTLHSWRRYRASAEALARLQRQTGAGE